MLETTLALLFGLLIGSFLNVCIFRLPRDRSVVTPRSYCPWCRTPIAWFDNIPVVSYILLGARCRSCKRRIWPRYIIVEVATGVLFAAIVSNLGATLLAVKFCLFASLMVGLIFSDLERRILPDEFTLGGAVAGVILAVFIPVDDGLVRLLLAFQRVDWPAPAVSVADALAGALIPSGFLWLAGFLFEKIRHKEGLGLGDVKMMMAVGAFLGIRGSLLSMIGGSVLGSVVGLAYILIQRKNAGTYPLPFGSFLGLAALGVAFVNAVNVVHG